MSYRLRGGKLVRRERLKRRKPEREPIKTGYQRELWNDGPVARLARNLARKEWEADLRRRGIDPRSMSERTFEVNVTRILFESGDAYVAKAKEWLR